MQEIKLDAKGAEQEALKAYLAENASEALAEKINHGVYIEKDGKRLLNKKNFESFMEYAVEEARKQAAQGARFACVISDEVFGWAIHYFEEESIIGKLYNEDGSEYKPVVKKSAPAPSAHTPAPVKKKEGGQISLFDSLVKPLQATERSLKDDGEEDVENIVEEENSEEFDDGATDEEETSSPPTVSPIITRYRNYADEEPGAIVVMRVGDFYEVLGEEAKRVGEAVSLTVVSRDIGTGERIPMVGFPFHRKEIYLEKICTLSPVYLIESEDEKVLLREEREDIPMVIDTETGEVFDEAETAGEFDEVLTRLFGKDWVIV